MLEVIVLVGLQGAGKSTFFAERFAKTHALVSKDLMRSGGNRDERQRRRIEEALAAGKPVVVDNTHVGREDRAKVIATARAQGARVIGYYFLPDVRASLRRNARRTGRARVPEVAIFAFAKRLEPPRRDEGFDELFHVRTVEGSGFEVAPAPA